MRAAAKLNVSQISQLEENSKLCSKLILRMLLIAFISDAELRKLKDASAWILT